MTGILTEKIKVVDALDRQMADDVDPVYTIELALLKSPKGEKCGAICIFKRSELNLPTPDKIDPKAIADIEKELSKQTESMYRDPEYFRKSNGQWIPWALERVLKLYDSFGGNAKVVVKCPTLRVRQRVSSKSIAAGRSDLKELFSGAFEIDKLLDEGYKYDPWLKGVRRGSVINAALAKR